MQSPKQRYRFIVLVTLAAAAGCDAARAADPAAPRQPAPEARRHPSHVHLPARQIGMTTGKRDLHGELVRIRCATCHRLLAPKVKYQMARSLERFHRTVAVDHGDLTCRTCHQPPLFETFKLGSGATLPYAKVMELCAQCHSRQRSDYRHGVHGGMTGYWDLERGPRDRNHCIDCHNPHRPAIGPVVPAPRPRYRFLDPDGDARSPHGAAQRSSR